MSPYPAGPDEDDGLTGDERERKGGAALRVRIELREDDPIDPERALEELGLLDHVVPRQRVPDEQRERGLGDPPDLLGLLDEVLVGVLTSRRIDEHDVDGLGLRVLDGVEGDRGRIAPLLLPDDRIPSFSPWTSNCSIAPARNVSPAAIATESPACLDQARDSSRPWSSCRFRSLRRTG